MRPATLAEAIERIVDGTPQEKALPEFLDTFYLAPTAEQQLAAICRTPRRDWRPSLDAFVGAAAEYLARQYQLPSIPEWVFEPHRYLDRAWHVSQLDDPRHARIPDLREPGRIPLAQHLHRRASAAPRASEGRLTLGVPVAVQTRA